jgi:hypothetical protein
VRAHSIDAARQSGLRARSWSLRSPGTDRGLIRTVATGSRQNFWIAFAAILNGSPRKPQVPHATALEAERADLDALLQEY